MGSELGHCRTRAALVAGALLIATGCMVGPDYVPPPAPAADAWTAAADPNVHTDRAESVRWWEVFGDSTLTRLVEMAYAQNLSLRAAGLRVLQAQARRGIAIGGFFPQTQALSGSYTHTRPSPNTQLGAARMGDVDAYTLGFDMAWEVDLWGKFRRGIEAADADLVASVARYDDVLVSLVAEVAATYVRIGVLNERLAVARSNVKTQADSLGIARIRFEQGGTSERDVQQAGTLLHDTEATIPQLEIQQRQALNSLAVLLGSPPRDLTDVVGTPPRPPVVPVSVAVGIPADLLHHRPDVRAAEFAVAAQSARIGVSVAQLLPAFKLTGSIGLSSEDAAKFFEGRAFEASVGPSFNWPILNYGRLINDVRVQDATFREFVATYANTMLVAQQEVENALVGYLRGRQQVARLEESVAAATRAVELSIIQYREGAIDYTAVLTTQQAKLREDDLLAATRGELALSVVALYKALGGGWELRDGHDVVDEATRQEMSERWYWGAAAAQPTATDAPRHWWSVW